MVWPCADALVRRVVMKTAAIMVKLEHFGVRPLERCVRWIIVMPVIVLPPGNW